MYDNEHFDASKAKGGVAFINPIYGEFGYAHAAAKSFFKWTHKDLGLGSLPDPLDLKPICINIDDASPKFHEQDWDQWHEDLPHERCFMLHRADNLGLTASWNQGLRLAREFGCKYAICGNADILFTPGWHRGLCWHLDHNSAHLVGPVTNAPGRTAQSAKLQNVVKYQSNYELSDEPRDLANTAAALREAYTPSRIEYAIINGFFMMSRLDYWWEGAFDEDHVFNPKMRLTGNEDELEDRWLKSGRKIGIVPSSFIFHYRSVARGDRFRTPGSYRMRALP